MSRCLEFQVSSGLCDFLLRLFWLVR
uniref:Uncharacterized protein n=1 Tax=Rhizophora mucronata TaxID=61149 RepID=A0A2P2L693_RHIMU